MVINKDSLTFHLEIVWVFCKIPLAGLEILSSFKFCAEMDFNLWTQTEKKLSGHITGCALRVYPIMINQSFSAL